jgi:membrane fusion protein (multidrug efflux system)
VGAGLRTLFEVGTVVGRSDGELLDLFLTAGGPAAELAFAALVERHGPMVWRVCRDTLRESNDADDAFQATFLVLVRRAGAIRKRSSLGPWLHGVALRVARSARRCAMRRRDRERVDAGPGSAPEESMAHVDRLDEAPILHEEVDRLPAKYREPLVLCYFQGLTHDEAASQLGWPVGTVRSRLAEARVRLRPRLLRRGVAPSVAILAASGRAEAAAVVPASLVSATIRMAVGAGAAGTVPASVAALVGTTLRGMTIVKTSMIATGLLAATLVSMVGAGRVAGVTRSEAGGIAGPPGQDDQAPRISVRTVRTTTVTIKQRYAAQIHSRRHIQVQALVEGFLTPIPIKEGQAVKAGDRMFEITSPILKARLRVGLAERDLAQAELNNTMKLSEQKAVSDDEMKLSKAKLAKAQAKVDLAKAELDFATIKAPFDGTVGRLNAQAGSNVKEGDTLTDLFDNSVMWVYFNVPEKSYLESMAGRREGEGSPAIELMLADRRKFPHPGKLGAIEARSKDGNGPIAHRADFPNPDGILQHGQKGTVSINRVLKDAIVIPKRATFEDHDKKYVYLIYNKNVARKREIAVRAEVDDEFVVEAGIKVGDRIVSDGVGKVHDGDKVKD